MRNLSQILTDVNSYVDLDASEPTGTELAVRTNYANQAVREWASAYEWDQLKVRHLYYATAATMPLPSAFRDMINAPRDINNNVYIQVKSEEAIKRNSSEAYFYLTGTPNGYQLTFNSFTGGTLSMMYQRYASGMATLTDICEVPDPEYVKMKVSSYILQSRSDDRFPSVEATANTMLQNMIGRAMRPLGGGVNTTPRRETYVMGE